MTDHKKYALGQVENFLYDAMSSGATPQEIYDVIKGVVQDNYYTYKKCASEAYELLGLLNGDGQPYEDVIKEREYYESSSQYTEEPKSPAEEAYKEVYGWYPPTTSSVSNYEDNRWSAFQNGYTSAKEDYEVGEYQPTSQEPEEVADGLKEAFREAIKQNIVSSVDKPKTMTDILYRWWCDVFTTHSDWDMETSIEDLVDQIEMWLPKEQSAAGSQNAYVECTVEGFNDCLTKIKGKLR